MICASYLQVSENTSLFELHSHHPYSTVHKNMSKTPYRPFPKEHGFISSSPPSGFTFQDWKRDGFLNDFPKGALRKLTLENNLVCPLKPLQRSPFIARPNDHLKFKSLKDFTNHDCPRWHWLVTRLNGSLWHILFGRRRWLLRIRFLQRLFVNLLQCIRAPRLTDLS